MNRTEEVAIDEAHAQIVYGVAVSLKPERTLELGFGSGLVTRKLQEAQDYNRLYKGAENQVLVDNWLDWGGKQPESELFNRLTVRTMAEKDFVKEAATIGRQFDLIFSDADHQHSHEWFGDVIGKLLAPGGVAFFHDVTSAEYKLGKNLDFLVVACSGGAPYMWKVFNKSSRDGERCERGLLMVWKKF